MERHRKRNTVRGEKKMWRHTDGRVTHGNHDVGVWRKEINVCRKMLVADFHALEDCLRLTAHKVHG